jgi:hypothetical protein
MSAGDLSRRCLPTAGHDDRAEHTHAKQRQGGGFRNRGHRAADPDRIAIDVDGIVQASRRLEVEVKDTEVLDDAATLQGDGEAVGLISIELAFGIFF